MAMNESTTTKRRIPKDSEGPLLLTEKDVAQLLGYSPRTLQKWRAAGVGPRFVKANRSVRYRREDLLLWIKDRIRRSTSDPGGSEED